MSVASPRGLPARGLESVSHHSGHTGQRMPAAGCWGLEVPLKLKHGWMRANARAYTHISNGRPGHWHQSLELWTHSVSDVKESLQKETVSTALVAQPHAHP